MSIRKIILEELEGLKDSSAEDWKWTENVPDIVDLKQLTTKKGTTTIYYFPYITKQEYNTHVLPSLEYWYPDFKITPYDYHEMDHIEIRDFHPPDVGMILNGMVGHFGVGTAIDMVNELDPNGRGNTINGRDLFNIPNTDITDRIAKHYLDDYEH